MAARSEVAGAGSVTERTPLLRSPADQPALNGTIEDGQPARENQVVAEEPEIEFSRLLIIMLAGWMGVFLSAADGVMVATLITPISSSFHAGKLVTWLATAYLIASAALQPLSGKLTDIYGRKAGLLASNVLFFAGTLICGLASTPWILIIGRIIAGMGGGCLNTITTFIGSDLIPLRKRGLWQGLGNVMFGLGAGVGGIYGGWINDILGWKWAFLTQVPLIAVSALVAQFSMTHPVLKAPDSGPKISRVDFLGSGIMVVSLILLLLGLNSGGNIVPWNHPLVWVSLPVAGILLVLFVYVEERISKEPVIPTRLLLNRTVAAAGLTNWFSTMAYYIAIFYGPIFFQALGYSSASAGARLIPSAMGASVGSLGAGFIMRATGRYYILQASTNFLAVVDAVLVNIFFVPGTPDWIAFVIYFVFGTTYGAMLTTTLLSLISAVDHKYQAVVTSISYAFRATGSTIGLAVAGAIFQNILSARLQVEFERDNPNLIPKIREDLGFLDELRPDLAQRARGCYVDASRGVWGALLGFSVLAWVSCLFIKQNVLHSTLARK